MDNLVFSVQCFDVSTRGSPVSAVVANLYVEFFKELACQLP